MAIFLAIIGRIYLAFSNTGMYLIEFFKYIFPFFFFFQESYERARQIVKNHSTEHKALAQALMKYETLDSDDIKAIVDGKVPSKLAS